MTAPQASARRDHIPSHRRPTRGDDNPPIRAEEPQHEPPVRRGPGDASAHRTPSGPSHIATHRHPDAGFTAVSARPQDEQNPDDTPDPTRTGELQAPPPVRRGLRGTNKVGS